MELLHKGFPYSIHVTDDTGGGLLVQSVLSLYSRITDTTYTTTPEESQVGEEADYTFTAETTADMLPGVYDLYLYNTENELIYYQHNFCCVIGAPVPETTKVEGLLS